mmetsp:Transcript_576/g.1934  ORF Transcript_576/g.1934 Transcript_576/m.1934 type:complete len:133 (-) Transcript_576:54-452(-)
MLGSPRITTVPSLAFQIGARPPPTPVKLDRATPIHKAPSTHKRPSSHPLLGDELLGARHRRVLLSGRSRPLQPKASLATLKVSFSIPRDGSVPPAKRHRPRPIQATRIPISKFLHVADADAYHLRFVSQPAG